MFPAGKLAKDWQPLKPECQHPGLCTDHPSRVDFSRVLGKGAGNMLLPVHDHFETTRNGNRPEWHNLYAFMVSKKASWEKADNSHNVRTLMHLSHVKGSGVRGPFPSNIFFFQTLPGSPSTAEYNYSQLPTPRVNPATNIDPSILGPGDPLINHVTGITGNTLMTFSGQVMQQFQITPTSPS